MLKTMSRHIFKSLLFYAIYLGAGAGACLLALFLSIYFLNPAVSQESPANMGANPAVPQESPANMGANPAVSQESPANMGVANPAVSQESPANMGVANPAVPQESPANGGVANPAVPQESPANMGVANPAVSQESPANGGVANPAVSQESPANMGANPNKPKKLTLQSIVKDIIKNTKNLIKNLTRKTNTVLQKQGVINTPPETPSLAQEGVASDLSNEGGSVSAPTQMEGTGQKIGLTEPMPTQEGVASDLSNEGGSVSAQMEGTGQKIGLTEPMPTQNTELDSSFRQPAGENTNPEEQTNNLHSPANLEVQSYMAPFIYESLKQKNPFNDPTIKQEKGIIIVPRTLPEKYELSDIKLKGMIWNNKIPKALFELPENNGFFTLLKGDKIGKNGVIFAIREDEVVIVETNHIGSGAQKKEEKVIKIKRMDRMNLSS